MIRDLRAGLFALLLVKAVHASANPLLQIPEFEGLAAKASESVTITLDSALLQMAARFLSAEDPEDAEVRKIIAGLKGVYVRSYSFDSDFAYPQADIASVRRQLSNPGWQRLVEVRSRKEGTAVDVFVSVGPGSNKANGLAIIASEPRQFTIVNIVGSIDLDTLHKLEGQLGVPDLELESKKPRAGN
jgi:hypothetical protein